ncbi:carbohydrate-binding module family 43 protein [Trematosphaeria pertusa]|uniref:1,3-beta-glucanosyltransferase n=1 Tax=Trematosphaeria pertusa TaxID=390896 RepID=A0A6A6I8J2_9PLEO|nr:carbohydrate-binding module family 43 protein [Trematosphaeria pertusa]KAF2246398.1 carbohydrate-binding module family 43 protein [Trematosphaeria pertusa]
MQVLLGRFSYLLLVLHLALFSTAELDPIVIKGSHFFYKTSGSAFFVRGLTYDPSTIASGDSTQRIDPLADGPTCLRDIPYMTALNINVLRIYYVDANADHTTCMNALADAGIYVVTTLGSPTAYINPYTGRWMDFTLAQYTSVVDSLASFTNVLGFDVGERRYNQTLPFLKAAVRDVKQHMRDKAYRDIPIGFTSAMLYPYSGYTELSYMACQEAQADFLGLAMADLTDITSCTPQTDIDAAIELYRNASIPVFGIETGCYTTDPSNDDRTFGYVYRFFAINATASLSGTVVLGFYQEVTRNSTWGLVSVGAGGEEIIPGEAYSALSSVMATVSPTFVASAEYTPTATPGAACPAVRFASPLLPPQPYTPLCSCMMDTLLCTAKKGSIESLDPETALNKIMEPCGNNLTQNCVGLVADGGTGQYGAFSSCNLTAQYSWAVNEYWQTHGDDSCDLDGTAELRGARPAPSGDCKFLLDQAGENGEKTVTAFLNSTPAPTSTSGATTESTTDDASTGKTSLSAGAKAGIGVGVFAFVVFALLGILYFLRRKKQENKAKEAPYEHDEPDLPEYVAPRTETRHLPHPVRPEGQGLMHSPPPQ